MFENNEVVKIKEFENDHFNYLGRVNDFDGFQYHVTNMNMPFMGVVSDWFFDYELDKIL